MEALDSKDELYFSWWCNDLIEAGILLQYHKAKEINLFSGIQHNYKEEKQLKKGIVLKDKSQSLMSSHLYTPDYELYFNISKSGKFVDILCDNPIKFEAPLIGYIDENTGNVKVIVEIKPIFDQNNMTRLFKLNQKWVYSTIGVYIDIIEYSTLFRDTFTPSRFLLTDKAKEQRVINKWKVRSLEEFLNL